MSSPPDNQTRAAGKTVAGKTYVHVDALDNGSDPDSDLVRRLAEAESLTGLRRGEAFNVLRVDAQSGELALLHYPGFFDTAFPALAESWRLDAASGPVSHRTYSDSLNPRFCTVRSCCCLRIILGGSFAPP